MDKRFAAVVFFAMLSCFSSVSTYFVYPIVSRTPNAIIIDFAGFSPFPIGRGYGQIAHPGFIPFNPYPFAPSIFYNGLPYSRQATLAACGKGATATPTSRSLISGKIVDNNVIDAAKNTWTFIVGLNYLDSDGNTALFCTGTLISATKVLSAASCIETMSLFQISTVTVTVGSYLALQTDAQMTRRVSKVVIHGQYNSATYANDIAILTLDMPVIFSRTVGPVCLPPASNDTDKYADQAAVLLGWDKGTGALPGATDVLQQSLQSIAYNVDCKADTTFGKYVTNSTTCLSSLTAGTCLWDIGGPLVINSAPNVPGTTAVWTIVGVNSFNAATSTSCGSSGLKTLVSAFVPWINTYIV